MDDIGAITPAVLAGLAIGVGAPIWAGVIFVVINTLKSVAKGVLDGRERVAAFVLSGVLVALGYITALQAVPPSAELGIFSILLAVLSWFNVGRLSMALHDDIAQKPNSLTGPSA